MYPLIPTLKLLVFPSSSWNRAGELGRDQKITAIFFRGFGMFEHILMSFASIKPSSLKIQNQEFLETTWPWELLHHGFPEIWSPSAVALLMFQRLWGLSYNFDWILGDNIQLDLMKAFQSISVWERISIFWIVIEIRKANVLEEHDHLMSAHQWRMVSMIKEMGVDGMCSFLCHRPRMNSVTCTRNLLARRSVLIA